MKLSDVKKNGRVKIINFLDVDENLYMRFLSFGLIRDKEIVIKNCSPFKTNVEIMIDNSFVALRREEAELIEVEHILEK